MGHIAIEKCDLTETLIFLAKGVSIPHEKSITDILDEQTIAMLRAVTSADCALIDPDDVRSRSPREITERVELTEEDVRLLVRLLVDVDSWCFPKKRCLPKTTAIVLLGSPAEEAKLLIDMSCIGWRLRASGPYAVGFFDLVADKVRGILKRTFPDIASNDPRSMWKTGAITDLKRRRLEDQLNDE